MRLMNCIEQQLRMELHKLLDKMLDENQPLGVLQKAFVDENLEIQYLNYRLTIRKGKGYYYGDME